MYPLIINFSPIYFYMFINFNKYITNKKLSRNYCSFFHILGCLFLSMIYFIYNNKLIFDINILFSIGYFIFDTMYILQYNNYNLYNISLLYHHFAIIYLLHYDHIIYQTHNILLLGEISNIPSNIVYYCIHTKNNKYMNELKYIQKYVYLVIRVIFYSYIIFERLYFLINNNYSLIPIIISFPVYIMGLIWSYKLIL